MIKEAVFGRLIISSEGRIDSRCKPTAKGHDLTGAMSKGGASIRLAFLKDANEIFCNQNDRPLTATFAFDSLIPTKPKNLQFVLERPNKLRVSITDSSGNGPLTSDSNQEQTAKALAELDFSEMTQYFSAFRDCFYVGAFRNAVNVGEGEYFDLALGTKFITQWKDWKSGVSKQQNKAIINVTDDIKALFNT